MNHAASTEAAGLNEPTSLEMKVLAWVSRAKSLWLKRSRPQSSSVSEDFARGDIETGKWLVSFTDFEISPVVIRQLSECYHFLSTKNMDYFLFSFLRGNILNRREADVSVELAADYILRGRVSDLTFRFNREELQLILEYFWLIAEVRGRAIDFEDAAKSRLMEALQLQEEANAKRCHSCQEPNAINE